MAYLILFFLVVITAKFKSKIVIPVLTIICFAILSTYNDNLPDRTYYYLYYHSLEVLKNEFEMGYYLLNKEFFLHGFDFYSFLLTVFLFCYTAIFLVSNKLGEKSRFTLILYGIFPFFINLCQIRTMIAVTITYCALLVLKKETIRSIIVYTVLILVAAQFHSSSYIFLLFAVLVCWKPRYLEKIIFIATFILVLGVNVLRSYLVELFPEWTKLEVWTSSKTEGSFMIVFLVNLIWFYLFHKFKKRDIKNNEQNDLSFYYNVTLVSFLFLPFISFSLQFLRLYRAIIMINYMGMAAKYKEVKGYSAKRIGDIGLFVLSMIILIILDEWSIIGIVLNENSVL